MNIEELPDEIKNDIEDQSLSILSLINKDIILIGGWAVRALLGENHGRYTLDVDGVSDPKKFKEIEKKLKNAGLNARNYEWGIQFHQKYKPKVTIDTKIKEEVNNIELRIEISGPRIKESDSQHFFEFSLTKFEKREIPYHSNNHKVLVYVPSPEDMAAVKLGLPVDYKNNYDAQMLLIICDIEKVIEKIKSNNDWYKMVIKRLPKIIGRIKDRDRIEHILAIEKGLNIKKQIKILEYIKNKLSP